MKARKQNVVIFLVITVLLVLLAVFGLGNELKSVRDTRFGIDIRGGVEAVFKPATDAEVTSSELDSARSIIETRMDSQKITDREVTVDREGGYIIVRFPWKSDETDFDPETAISELGEMARLTFRDPEGNVMVEGKNVVSADPAVENQNGMNQYVVQLTFDNEGAKKFQEATGKLVGQQMGIYMDDTLLSNPVVQTEISGGTAVITGMETYQVAEALAEKINAGALPFALETRSFSTISPSLGQNALVVMIYSAIVAFILVCLFMIFFYRLPGFVACLTLFFQMVLQLLAISIPQYTLTLPGIAGIILSVGMAVDANVIISERISEELAKGETLKSAVRRGYSKAFTSVLDGNVTTAIVAIVLMIFGSGTMLSFGYTLLVGVIVNCFVGVNVSRFVLQSLLEYKGLHKESLFRKKKEKKNLQFFENKKISAIITVVIFIAGIGAIFVRGVKLDTQFTGGTVIDYTVSTNSVDTEDVSKAVTAAVNRNATVQLSNSQAGTSIIVTLAGNNGLLPEEQKKVNQAVGENIGIQNLEPSQTFAVEPYVGAKALRNAVIAVLLAFGCILAYIGIRFATLSGLSAGLTALIALLHDVCIVLFAFTIFGISLGDSFVAVVLTIIGYSINDTIVVYDRIRENKNMNPKKPLSELVNESVTQVLSRSINTSITTLLCVAVILVASVMYHISSIYNFSLPMLFGLISGCYSSICIAAALWATWKSKKKSE
ncbi:MAG: protein translocase subunit SecF [Lachnospiraceae bacterium]|nr:protein translocase subunit SecF [Lachnospiraceae bacterium]